LDRMLEDHKKSLYQGCDNGLKKLDRQKSSCLRCQEDYERRQRGTCCRRRLHGLQCS
jgi:hypothetical protein